MSKKTFLSLMALALLFMVSPILKADNKDYYSVYCADGKIEVEMRNLEQMKSARGSNVCSMQKFESASSAEDFAKKQGGKGSACSCR